MTDSPRTQLERAYRLIQQDNLDEALRIIKPITVKEPNNIDAWWLMSHATLNTSEARTALDNVLRLNPKHVEARQQLDQLNQSVSPADDFADIELNPADPFAKLKAAPVAARAVVPVDADDSDLWGASSDAKTPNFVEKEALAEVGAAQSGAGAAVRRPIKPVPASSTSGPMARPRTNSALLGLLALLIIAVIVAAGAYVLTRPSNVPATTTLPTMIALAPATGAATLASTPDVSLSPIATSALSTPNPSGATAAPVAADALNAVVQAAISQFQAQGNKDATAQIGTSSLGQTLTVRFCAKSGPTLVKTVDNAMDSLATLGAPLNGSIQAISVEIANCGSASQTLYKAVAAIQDVTAYVSKATSARQFRTTWKTS